MRRYLNSLISGSVIAVLALSWYGCGSSGSSGSSSDVGITGTVNVPSGASTSESVPLGKSLSKSLGASKAVEVPELAISDLSKDTPVSSGKEVTVTDAKTGTVLATGKTDSAGGYSVNIASTATDCIISVKLDSDGSTELNRFYTSSGSAATGVAVDSDTTTATLSVLQKCQELAGVATDIDISELPAKCGAAITAGTFIPAAINTTYLELVKSGVAAGSADASTGKGTAGAQGLLFREILSNKLKGSLKGEDPWDVMRKAYLTSDSAALAKIGTFAPTVSATASPSAVISFAKDSLMKAISSVVNNATTWNSVKTDPGATASFFGNLDASSANKIWANPEDMQVQLIDSYTNNKTAKLGDSKFATFFVEGCRDGVQSEAEIKAYTQLVYTTDGSSKTADDISTLAAAYKNTVIAACPSGTCDTSKVQSIHNNPDDYLKSIEANPKLYSGSGGATYASGLINQYGATTEVITGTVGYTACATASDCGTGSVCVNNFCQYTATIKAVGESCSLNGDCGSGTCDSVSGATGKICKEPAVATGGTGGAFTALLSNGSSCTFGNQCSSNFCDPSTNTCKSTADIPLIGGNQLGGLYKKAATPTNILGADLNLTPNSSATPPTVSVSLSGGLYGTFTGSVNQSGQITFTGSVYDAGTTKTLTCTNISATNSGGTLSCTDCCTLAGTSKSINHTKQ